VPRVTVDTNFYISALNFGGMTERLLLLADTGAVQLLTSSAILEEAGRVLRGDKFEWPSPQVEKALAAGRCSQSSACALTSASPPMSPCRCPKPPPV
jgi:predicted nucleic acid-binding protein